MCKYSSNIHLPRISPQRWRDKIKCESKWKFASLNHDLREEVLKFYFHILSNMMEDKTTMNTERDLKKQQQTNSLGVNCAAFASFYTSFIWNKSLLTFLNRQISTLCCIFTVRTIKRKVVLDSQFAKSFIKLDKDFKQIIS